MMRIMLTCVVALLMLPELSTAAANSTPAFEWLPEANSETRRAANQFFATANLPHKQTRVLYKINTRIDRNTVIERVKVVRFFPTQSDIEQDGNGVIYWDQEIESLKILEAGVVSASKRYQRFQKENYRVLDDDSYNTFTNHKRVIIPFSGLQAGDVSVLEYESTYNLSELESNWSHSYYPVTLNDTLRFELSVTSNSVKLNSSVIGDRYNCEKSDYSLRCSAENLQAYQSDSGVIWRDVVDQIYISNLFTWDQVIDHTLHAFNKAELGSGAVDSLLERLIGSATTMEDKITRIQNYVSRDIRYISLSELGHRITPHTVASVEKNKFGDCKDKTAMLVALLRKLGLNAEPYLVATKRDAASKLIVPSGGYFDHMVACFTYENQQICIDGTDGDTNWQYISSWIQGAVVLPLVEGATPVELDSTQPRWVLEIDTNLKFDASGKQKESQVRRYLLSYAGDVSASYRPMSDEEKKNTAVKQYHQWVSNSVTPSFTFQESNAISGRFVIESTAEYEPFLDVEADMDYNERDHWLRYELLESRLKTEHYDTEFEGLQVESTLNLDVSSLWTPTRLPPDLDLQGRYGTMTRTSEHKRNGVIEVKTSLNVPRQPIGKSEINAFNNYLALLATESLVTVQGQLKSQDNGK